MKISLFTYCLISSIISLTATISLITIADKEIGEISNKIRKLDQKVSNQKAITDTLKYEVVYYNILNQLCKFNDSTTYLCFYRDEMVNVKFNTDSVIKEYTVNKIVFRKCSILCPQCYGRHFDRFNFFVDSLTG